MEEEYKGQIGTAKELLQEHSSESAPQVLPPNEEIGISNAKTPREHFIDEHRTEINDDDLSFFPRPRSGCKHCYGRGSEGWNVTRQEIVLCRCIRNRIFTEVRQEKLLTYGELKEIYNAPRRVRGLEDITKESCLREMEGVTNEVSTKAI